MARRYDLAMRPLDKWLLARLRARVMAALPPDGRILELGAGTGLNFVFYPATARGVAIEPSCEMLRIAVKKRKPDGIRLVQSRAESLPFRDSSFDAAFATLVFCSIDSQPQAFAELRRVVRKGGQVVLLEHVRPANMLGPVVDLLSRITVPLFNDHLNRRTAEQARASGLQVVNVEERGLGILNLITCRV